MAARTRRAGLNVISVPPSRTRGGYKGGGLAVASLELPKHTNSVPINISRFVTEDYSGVGAGDDTSWEDSPPTMVNSATLHH
jgi:hypothetical protein